MDKQMEGAGVGQNADEEMKIDNESINLELWKWRRHAVDLVL